MKSTERQRLKENDLADAIANAGAFVESNKQQVGVIVAIVVVIAIAVGGFLALRGRTDDRGQDLLADAMVTLNARVVPATPASTDKPGELPAAATMGALGTYPSEEAKLTAALPKLKAAADAYPDSEAGITARYHYAATLASLGRQPEAITAFEEVGKRAGADSLYGRMASLGKADTQAKSGQLDAAIATWKQLVDSKAAGVPEDAILMELGRAYQSKGSKDEARKTFSQLVEQHPTSPYAGEARAELENLKG